MDEPLKKLLYSNFHVNPTPNHVAMLNRFVHQFETRPGNAEAFGSALLGVSKAYWLPTDDQELFRIFDIDYGRFRTTVHSADEVDKTRVVTSDPYNILTIWLLHLFTVSKNISQKASYNSRIALLKMMQYRVFTSVVGHNLRHGANEGVMQYTIDHLNNKFEIKEAGSWKALIEKKSEDVISDTGIHRKRLLTFEKVDGNDVLYIISDIQTRIRKQIVLVIHHETLGYHANNNKGNSIGSTSMVEDINGDRMLRIIETSMDSMVSAVANSATNLTEFLDYEYIKGAVDMSNDLTEDLFIKLLTKFSAVAEMQAKRGKQNVVKGTRKAPIFIGYNVLISTILQKTYRLCVLDKEVNIGSKAEIINKTRNVYRSSRTVDEDVMAIKESVANFVNTYSPSKRDVTNASMRITFIVYLMLLSFRHVK